MPLDYDRIMALPPLITGQSLTARDTILYALGVGATDLRHVYEEGLEALPTMAVVLASPGFFFRRPEYGLNWRTMLHGDQSISLHRPLSVTGEFIGETVIEEIVDKGADRGAVMRVRHEIRDAQSNAPVATTWGSFILRDDGGFGQGGQTRAPRPHPLPERDCDAAVSLPTGAHQHLLYRLSGDHNPLHVDPAAAQAAGFERPILHGLCTYGVAGRALIRTLCDDDGARLTRMDARFSGPVVPGDTIRTEIWREGEGRAAFRAFSEERGQLVLNNGYVEFKSG